MNDIRMNPKGKYAIILPNWNRVEFVRLCISAIAKNTDFSLVHSVNIYDNDSRDGAWPVLAFSDFDAKQGKFNCANSCLNEILKEPGLDAVKYVVKIDSDTIVKKNWLNKCDEFLKSEKMIGQLHIRKQIAGKVPVECNEHGGNFITLLSLMRKFKQFRVNSPYPGCQDYGMFVVKEGYKRYSIPGISYDISKKREFAELVERYRKQGWMR